MPDPDLTWRSLEPADVPDYAELLAAAEAVDQTGEHYAEADLQQQMQDDSLDLALDTWAVLDGSGLVAAGAVLGAVEVWDVHTVHCFGVVHPGHRGRGIGRELLGRQLDRAAQLHAARHPRHPARLAVGVFDHNTPAAALMRSAGLSRERHFFDMELDLRAGDAPRRDLPAPLRIVGFGWDRDDEVRRAHNVAFRDHYGSTERDPASWKQWFTGSRNFRAEDSYLVLAGPEPDAPVAAYLLTYFYDADQAATGKRQAHIGQLGTLPLYRGRGAGTALLAHALPAFRDAGYDLSGLDVDSANGSGALGLYQRLGFAVTHSVTSWERVVPAVP